MKRVTVSPPAAWWSTWKRQSRSSWPVRSAIKKRPLLQVDAPPREVLEALADERNPLYEEIADVTIRTDDQSAKVVANQIIHMLESN